MRFRDVNGWIEVVARILATREFAAALTDDTRSPSRAERVSTALHPRNDPLPHRVPGPNLRLEAAGRPRDLRGT
jgi:hypothetical protein